MFYDGKGMESGQNRGAKSLEVEKRARTRIDLNGRIGPRAIGGTTVKLNSKVRFSTVNRHRHEVSNQNSINILIDCDDWTRTRPSLPGLLSPS